MLKQLRRLIVAVIGGTVVAIGVAMVVLPGPAILVMPTGLAILATEFLWARRLLQRMRRGAAALTRRGDKPPEGGGRAEASGPGEPRSV